MDEIWREPIPGLRLRFAREGDEGRILDLIRELAAYEKLEDEVAATEATLRESLFVERSAEAILAYSGEALIGYGIYFHNFSTFTGRKGLYLEDIYIRPEHRKRGFGKAFFRYIAGLARERGCSRMEWACLDWNRPSIEFYRSLGAQPMGEWTVYRLDEKGLAALGEDSTGSRMA